MITDWWVIFFLVGAGAERLAARRFSQRAVRGEVKMTWTLMTLDILHSLIFLGAAAEYFIKRDGLNWWVVGLGVLGYVVSLLVRHTAIRALGRYWSLHLEIREGHELIREGIYRYMRHPAYASIILEVVAVPLVVNSYWILIVSLGLYIPVLLTRWAGEEREMVAKFGDQYRQYQRETPAFLPRWPSR